MDSTTTTWPATLPAPLRTVRLKQAPRRLSTTMESGRTRNRRQYEDPQELWSVSWLFTDAQFVIFQDYFATTLQNGALSFLLQMFTQEDEVAFYDANYRFSRADGFVQVTATLEGALFSYPVTYAHEFKVWDEGGPVIAINSDLDFGTWLDGSPVVDIDETKG